jgi:hypothetical protein
MTRKLPLVLALLAAVAAAPAARAGDVETVEAKATFADVKQDVADAIVNRGYVIDYTARIGEMLDRTGADVGSTKKVYTGAETAQFCSAVLSRAMMEADPGNIAFCPYVVFYYERADSPGTVVVGYRPLDEAGSQASAAAKKQINALLAEIVREAAGAK